TLEELGIGRPSTYSPTIDTIQKRNYVRMDQKRFMPPEIGEIVHQSMEEHSPDIIDVDFTKTMEADLDSVAEGKASWKKVIDDFYKEFEPREIGRASCRERV